MVVYIVLIVLFCLLSALFSSMETAFASVSQIRLGHMAEKGDKKAALAIKIATEYERALIAILIGNNVVNIGATSLATLIFTRWLGAGGAAVSTVVMTLLVLTFCEVLPKSYAKSHAEKMALAVAGGLDKFLRVMKPFIWIFQRLSGVFSHTDEATGVTEDELRYLIDEIEEEGTIEEQESELALQALQFDDKSVGQVLTPRVQIAAVSVTASIEKIKELFLESGYSRIPVYENDIDHIIGQVTSRDFFRLICGRFNALSQIITPVLFIPESRRLSDTLRDMQHRHIHLAVVVDGHGGTEGIITLEDIIEELVGEIYDENDEVTEPIRQIAPHTYMVLGLCNLVDFWNGLEEADRPIEIPQTSASSVSELICESLGEIPAVSATLEFEGMCFTVLEVDNQCVHRVRVEKLSPKETDTE